MNQHIRLMPDEIEALESFAQAHGIPATLDHLGLDGLGNQVNGLIEQNEVLTRQRDSLQREADMYRADRDEYDAILGRKMDALNSLREQLETAHAAAEDTALAANLFKEQRDRLQEQLEAQRRYMQRALDQLDDPGILWIGAAQTLRAGLAESNPASAPDVQGSLDSSAPDVSGVPDLRGDVSGRVTPEESGAESSPATGRTISVEITGDGSGVALPEIQETPVGVEPTPRIAGPRTCNPGAGSPDASPATVSESEGLRGVDYSLSGWRDTSGAPAPNPARPPYPMPYGKGGNLSESSPASEPDGPVAFEGTLMDGLEEPYVDQ